MQTFKLLKFSPTHMPIFFFFLPLSPELLDDDDDDLKDELVWSNIYQRSIYSNTVN